MMRAFQSLLLAAVSGLGLPALAQSDPVLQQQDRLQAQQEHIERLEARLTPDDIVDGVLSRPFFW